MKIGPVSAMIESDLSRRESSREAVGAESGGCVEVRNFERCSTRVPVLDFDYFGETPKTTRVSWRNRPVLG